MRTSLEALNNLMFEQLENLVGAETEEELNSEIKRGDAMSKIFKNVTDNAELVLDAHKFYQTIGDVRTAPKLLMGDTMNENKKQSSR